jgi:PBP4 family serine-type D-alanyl-D-alanine carboxypeptidase
MKTFFRCLLVSAAVLLADVAAVPADIQAVMNQPFYAKGTWGLRVLDGKNVLIDLHPRRQFYIGSVRKVFSVGQLLNAVGASHRYNTPVYRTGSVDNGVLHGNLILVASGDLTMGGRTNPDGSIAVSDWDHNEADTLGNAVLTEPDPLAGYRTIAQAVRAAGITRIDGDVIVDDRLWVPWLFREQFSVKPIFVNDDVVDASIVPGGKVGSLADMTTRPVSAALAVNNELRVGPPGSENTLKIDPELPQCIGTAGCSSQIEGSLPSDFVPPLTNRPPLVRTVRITDPSSYARTVLVEQLASAGVTTSAPEVEPNPAGVLPRKGTYRAADMVTQLTGMPEGDNAQFVLKISYNIGADTSLVLFGLTRGADSMPGALLAEQKNLAANFGIPIGEYHFVDGSGGGETTATNGAVTKMLTELQRKPGYAAFFNALPVLAVDGSLASVTDFQKDPTLKGATGNVRAKTGTFVGGTSPQSVMLKGQAFGGYITTRRGHRLVYQLVVNDIPISDIGDVLKVFQDEGTISAILWRDY